MERRQASIYVDFHLNIGFFPLEKKSLVSYPKKKKNLPNRKKKRNRFIVFSIDIDAD